MKKNIIIFLLIIAIFISSIMLISGCEHTQSIDGVYTFLYSPEDDSLSGYNKNITYTAIIIQDKMTIIESGYIIIDIPPYTDENNNFYPSINQKEDVYNTYLFSISKENNNYYATELYSDNNSSKNIQLKFDFEKGQLELNLYDNYILFKKETDYKYIDAPKKLEAPKNLTTKIGTNVNKNSYVNFSGEYLDTFGKFGIKTDIKNTNNDYNFFNKQKFYINKDISFNLYGYDFCQGDNYIRISNIGGPILNDNNEYFFQTNSDYIEYKITIDQDIITDIQQIE